jgi:hypothetical protein
MKLILEGWRKFMKEEKVDPRMKKHLDKHPYMEPDGLREKKWEDFGIDKGEWREFSPSEIESSRDPVNVDVAEELFALIDNAYKDIGGNFDFQNPADLPGNSDYWAAIDIDDDPEPDALKVGKRKPFGLKSTAAGHDGSRAGIEAYKNKTAELLSTPGNYGEMSKGLAHVLLKYFDTPHVSDPEIVQAVLGPSKPIQWLGAHPEGKYPGVDGWYTRTIKGKPGELKIMLGIPNV